MFPVYRCLSKVILRQRTSKTLYLTWETLQLLTGKCRIVNQLPTDFSQLYNDPWSVVNFQFIFVITHQWLVLMQSLGDSTITVFAHQAYDLTIGYLFVYLLLFIQLVSGLFCLLGVIKYCQMLFSAIWKCCFVCFDLWFGNGCKTNQVYPHTVPKRLKFQILSKCK